MRGQLLTGYFLHHKSYQEKRAIYYFFTNTHGIVHGIGKKGMPLFSYIQLFATGKQSLKNFSQIQLAKDSKNQSLLSGTNQFSGFYLNELIWRLLGREDPMPQLWQSYKTCLQCFQSKLSSDDLKLLLRWFEWSFFNELGYSIDYKTDYQGNPIQPNLCYRYSAGEGFINHSSINTNESNDFLISGTNIHSMYSLQIKLLEHTQPSFSQLSLSNMEPKILSIWSYIHKQMVDFLLDYKPLKSRELWLQFHSYQR